MFMAGVIGFIRFLFSLTALFTWELSTDIHDDLLEKSAKFLEKIKTK